MFVNYAMRVNLSVAIVSMVNQTYANENKTAVRECGGSVNTTDQISTNEVRILSTLSIVFVFLSILFFILPGKKHCKVSVTRLLKS